jgi:two-component system, sensor histidine kinase and response regulator
VPPMGGTGLLDQAVTAGALRAQVCLKPAIFLPIGCVEGSAPIISKYPSSLTRLRAIWRLFLSWNCTISLSGPGIACFAAISLGLCAVAALFLRTAPGIVIAVGALCALAGIVLAVLNSEDAANVLAQQADWQEQLLKNRRLIEHLNMATLSAGISSWELDLLTRRYLWIQNPISSLHAAVGAGADELDIDALEALVVEEDRKIFPEVIRTAVAQRTDRISLRYRAYGADRRSIVHIQNFGRLIFDAQGRPAKLLGVSWDITDEVLAAERLESAQRRFQRAIQGTQDGLWELEINTDTHWCSPRLAQLLGHSVATLGERNFLRALAHPEDAAIVAMAMENHYQHDAPFDLELRLKTAASGYRWYRARASAERDTQGVPTRLSGSLQDVTEGVLRAKN